MGLGVLGSTVFRRLGCTQKTSRKFKFVSKKQVFLGLLEVKTCHLSGIPRKNQAFSTYQDLADSHFARIHEAMVAGRHTHHCSNAQVLEFV